jgi:hypothetical protein
MIKKFLLTLLEMTSESVYAKTGQKAFYSGLYRSGNSFVALTKGETFPPSINAQWTLVVNV